MGEIKKQAHQGILFFGLLATSADLVSEVIRRLALDYSAVAETIAAVVSEGKFRLIETAARQLGGG